MIYLILTVQVPLTLPVVFCETDSVFFSKQILKSKYSTNICKFSIPIQIGQLKSLQVLVEMHSEYCKVYCVLQCNLIM